MQIGNAVILAQVQDFPGWDGFLGTRASFMMDVVVAAMAVVLAILAWSVRLPRQGKYELHRRVQLTLAVVLLATVAAFELDVRVNGWRDRAAGVLDGEPATTVWISLWVHLLFAVTTVLLWPVVIWLAVKRFPRPPAPGEHSAVHVRWARLAAWDMAATAVTGWVFYYLAFMS